MSNSAEQSFSEQLANVREAVGRDFNTEQMAALAGKLSVLKAVIVAARAEERESKPLWRPPAAVPRQAPEIVTPRRSVGRTSLRSLRHPDDQGRPT